MSRPSRIDMLTPAQARDRLALPETAVIDLVNRGQLAAYRLGGDIRFKAADVRACAAAV